jgi:hypothetical protein
MAASARAGVGRGEPVRDATRTLSEWLAEWRMTFLRARGRAESTKDLYAGLTERHVEPPIGHLALGKVKSSDIARVLLHMEQLGRASTRRNAYAALRSAVDDAVVDGLLAASPVLGVKRPKATQDILSSRCTSRCETGRQKPNPALLPARDFRSGPGARHPATHEFPLARADYSSSTEMESSVISTTSSSERTWAMHLNRTDDKRIVVQSPSS